MKSSLLEQQLAAVRRGRGPSGAPKNNFSKCQQKTVQNHPKKQVLPLNAFELKLGATVEVSRVGYPCAYVS